MELLQLKYFKTVAETGKISEAAKSLFISAPALSTAISRLEKELGMPLFRRTNNRILLNRQGRIFLRYVNQIFGDLQSAQTELQQSVMQPGKYISLASVASTQWVDMITAFTEENPGFTLRCTSIRRADIAGIGLSAQYSFLLAAENDIPEYYAEKLSSRFLFEDHPVVMVSPDHPLASKESVELRELTRHNLFLPMRDYPLYDHLAGLFRGCGIPFPAGNAYSHLTAQHLAAKGLGVAFATSHTGLTPGLVLKYIPIRNDNKPWPTRIYWRKDHALTEDEQHFFDFIVTYFSQED